MSHSIVFLATIDTDGPFVAVSGFIWIIATLVSFASSLPALALCLFKGQAARVLRFGKVGLGSGMIALAVPIIATLVEVGSGGMSTDRFVGVVGAWLVTGCAPLMAFLASSYARRTLAAEAGSKNPALTSVLACQWILTRQQKVGMVVCLAVISLLLIGTGAYHWSLSSRINQRLAEIRASKEPVTLSDLNEYYPQIPDASNAAVIYRRAFELVEKSRSALFLQRLEELPLGSDALPVGIREAMLKACQDNNEAMGTLSEAAKLRQCRYPVDYRPGWAALLPHLQHLRKCAALEMSYGVLNEEKGDVQEALSCITRILSFSASLDSEPDLISVIVQGKLDFHAAELLRWVLNHRKLSEGQLEGLEAIFQAQAHTHRLGDALIGERCFVLATFGYSSGQILDAIDPGYEHRALAILGIDILKISGALKRDEIRFLERVNQGREVIGLPFPERLEQAEQIRTSIIHEARPKKFILTGLLFPMFFKGIGTYDAQTSARRQLVMTALAVEKYRTVRNYLPESLSELTPALLNEVPHDPFTHASILYHRKASGYVLYSVGPDRLDGEGKRPVSLNAKLENPEGDIIFEVAR